MLLTCLFLMPHANYALIYYTFKKSIPSKWRYFRFRDQRVLADIWIAWQDMVTQNFLKSLVTTFNPQEHAKTPILSCTPEYRILPKLNIPLDFLVVISMKTAFILNFLLQVEICMAVTSSVNTPSYTATSWLHLTHIDKDLHASAGQVGSVL